MKIQSRVMSLAWYYFKNNKLDSFSDCLKLAWYNIKNKQEPIRYRKFLNNIFNKLSFISYKKAYVNDNNEIVYSNGTKEYWCIVTKPGIKKSNDEEVKELVEEGKIPAGDIINYRRRNRLKFNFTSPKQRERIKRPRIKTKNYVTENIQL